MTNEERSIENELQIKKINNQMKDFGEVKENHGENLIKSLELEIFPSINDKIMEQVKNSFRVALDGYQTKNAFDFVFTDFRDKYEANLKYQNNTNKNIDAQLKEIEKYTTDIKENYCLTETLDRTVRKYTLQDQFDVLEKRSKDFVL